MRTTLDLAAFVASLPSASLARVYDSPDACVAVLRGLPPVARAYALRMAPLEGGAVPGSVVAGWPAPSAASAHGAAVAKLISLGVATDTGDGGLALAAPFAAHVSAAAATGRPPAPPPLPAGVAAAAPDDAARDAHADAAWDGVLLFVGGEARTPPRAVRRPPDAGLPLDIAALVASAGLVTGAASARRPTPAGLAFLLATTPAQLWTLLAVHASSAPPEAVGGIVTLLLRLAAGGAGRRDAVAARGLPGAQVAAAADVAALGLLLPFEVDGETYYAPTRLAAALASARGGVGSGGETAPQPSLLLGPAPPGDGYIVVETNFRVYAYTASPARRAAVGRVAAVERVLPDLVAATLTRASVLAAVDAGLTAEAIVAFLRDHASLHVSHRAATVPATVADAVRLWAASRSRFTAAPAVLYDGFEGGEWDAAVGVASAEGALLWRGGGRGCRLVVAADAHAAVADAIRAARAG